MALNRLRDSRGQFILQENKPISKTIKLPKQQVDALSKLIADGEVFSDKVREAITFYLDSHK